MGKLYIAEKRDLGEKVVAALVKLSGTRAEEHYGAGKTGHITVGEDAVTWLRGHMYDTCKPPAFGYAFGDIDSLPVVIADRDWRREIVPDKMGWNRRQEAEIKSLLRRYDRYVNVGDPEREGQYLIDEALEQWDIDPFSPAVTRLWFDDMVVTTLARAVEDQFLNAEKQTLFESALARAQMDYEWGMTFTGLVTELVRRAGGDGLFSVGRLQTTIQRIIHDRDKARREFVPVDHFVPQAACTHPGGKFKARWKWGDIALDEMGRLVDRRIVDALAARIKGKEGQVTGFTRTPKSTGQPLPFHLASVTIELAARYNYTAAQTLALAAKLYLYQPEGLSSYPRGDTRYLTRAVRDEEVPLIMRNLAEIDDFAEMVRGADLSITSKCWDDSKVTDHYALIPTSKLDKAAWDGLDEQERNFLRATTRQLIAQFYPPMRHDALGADIACAGETFRASGRLVTDLGWKKLFHDVPEELADAADREPTLPDMKPGDRVTIDDLEFGATRTTIPPRLNDGSLISLLEAPASLVTDPALRKKFRETTGIGRPSTRSSTIETLIARGYLTRPNKKKALELETTELGYAMIEAFPEALKSIGMTALWEERLANIRDGKESRATFKAEVEAEILALTNALRAQYGQSGMALKGMQTREPMEGEGNPCPKCGQGHLKTIFYAKDGKQKRALTCDRGRELCDYVVFDGPKIEKMPGDGDLCAKCGIGHMKTIGYPDKNKRGAIKRALVCDRPREDCGNIIFDSPPVEKMKGDGELCAKCGIGHMKTFAFPSKTQKGVMRRAMACDRGRAVCDNFILDMPPVEKMPGDGNPCPKCGKGHLTTIGYPDKKKPGATKRALICDQGRAVCDYVVFDGPEPMKGHGEPCAKCGKGHMKTIAFPDPKRRGAIRRALVCDQGRDVCDAVIFEESGPPIRPLPGDGKECPKCGKGHMKTIRFPSKTKPGTMITCLACDQGRDACGHIEFDNGPAPSPLPGDGKTCAKCGIGHMKTRMIPSKKKPGEKFIALACDRRECGELEFPARKGRHK